MDIRLKRAYDPPSQSDGYRVLVYSADDEEHNDAVVLAEVLRRGLPKKGVAKSKTTS